ncbi:4-hydroxyphenylpyruvate dioxygenase [Microbispora sp. ZYX-F-249]|uniref:4-hydroxyphenylpyruvate dioxygenase n=1 Tax=Microbispora maris TaxID=3144104 RepID=A0ABV0AXD6_9ACTN
MAASTHAYDDMSVGHIEFYVDDAGAAADRLFGGFGFERTTLPGRPGWCRSLLLTGGRIRLVLTEALSPEHPAAAYVERHGDGVADIALRVPDVAAAFAEATRRGARAVTPPEGDGDAVTARIEGSGGVVHTFVQGVPDTGPALPGRGGAPAEVDHFAVCVEPGRIDDTVEFYRRVLGFELVFTEHVVVGSQAMTTKVVQSGSGGVTLTLIEPDVTRVSGHIDDFLRDHGGAGVQHIAFTVPDIVAAVGTLASRGVEFLPTPAAYYRLLPERLEPLRHRVEELRRLNILVDEDHDGQLFQIFTRSTHPRGTYFSELIERIGAKTFGSGNIAALYTAVELQRETGEAEEAA